MSCCKIWIVIGILAIVTISIVLATSDPGYSKYYRLYANRKKGYSGYGSSVLTKPYHDPYYRNIGEAYRSLPTRRGKSYLNAHSPYGGYQNRAYNKEHLPHHKYSRGGINPHLGYHAKHGSYRQPINRPTPYPKPYPMPHPEPHPIPHPEPHPIPHPEPHPIPHPHPNPAPHPIPHPHPVPHPQPTPLPHPHPQPIPQPNPVPAPMPHPQPHPVPAPTPIPFPTPAPQPHPQEVPDVIVEEPDFVEPLPIRPIRPIETIGRPPVAPSVKPPTFFELQRSVPGFVDIQRVNIHPHGQPIIQQLTPEQQLNILQFPIQNTIANEEPKFVEIESQPNQPFEPLFPIEEVVPMEATRIIQPLFKAQPQNFQQIPRQNVEVVPMGATRIIQPLFEAQQQNFQQIPRQNAVNIPLLAKAVPAVPESNPQPLFKNVTPATAQATALLLQASRAEFGGVPGPIPVETSGNTRIPPVQQIPSVARQIDFSRFPSVVLPKPVPAVPRTQP